MTDQSEPEYITMKTAAALVETTVEGIRWRINSGQLPAYRFGNRSVRLRRADVLALLTPISEVTDEA